MRILNISDFHLSGYLAESKLRLLQEVVTRETFDLLVFNGDIFNQSRAGDQYMATQPMVAALERILTFDKPVVMVEGNHDQFGTRGSGLDLLHMPNLTKVQDEPMWMGFGDTEIIFVPWLRNRPDYKEVVLGFLDAHVGERQHRLIMGHMNIAGAKMNGTHSVNEEDYMCFTLRRLRCNRFGATALVAGHLHTRQHLGLQGGCLCYAGAFTQNNFGEEGNPQGYLVWDQGDYEFKDVEGPRFLTVTEQEYLSLEPPNEFYRFVTENPERYKDLKNVKPLLVEEETGLVSQETYQNDLRLKDLIRQFCADRKLEIPKSQFILDELEQLEVRICRAQTGFSRINEIKLSNFGPKDNVIFRYQEFKPENGLTALVGVNGKGKTLLCESLLAGLYGSYVERGALKNFLEAPGASLELSVSADGREHHVSHKKGPKGLLSVVDGTTCNLRGEVESMVVPIFGDATTFSNVVFMDQHNKKDLVEAEEAARIALFRSLLNLDFLEQYREQYSKELKRLEADQKEYFRLAEQMQAAALREQRLQEDLNEIKYTGINVAQLETKIAKLRENKQLYQQQRDWKSLTDEAAELAKTYQGQDMSDLLGRAQLAERTRMQIQQQEQIINGAQIGCAPNYLSCSFLRNFSKEKLEELKQVYAENKLSPAEQAYLNNYNEVKRKDLRAAGLYKTAFEGLEPIQESVDELQAVLDRERQTQKHLVTLKRELSLATTDRIKAQAGLEALEGAGERKKEVEFLLTLCDKKGLPLYIISSITSELQKILNELCSICDNGLRVRINMSKQGKEQEQVSAELDCFQIQYSWKGSPWANVKPAASGGQRTLIRIVFKLALMLYLNKFFGNYQVLIMDEPEKGLDVKNIDAMLNMLAALKNQFTQVIVVTHSDFICQIADQTIRIGE